MQLAEFSELVFFSTAWPTVIFLSKYGSDSSILSFVLSMLWNVSKNFHMKYFAGLSLGHLHSFHHNQFSHVMSVSSPSLSTCRAHLGSLKRQQCQHTPVSNFFSNSIYKGFGFYFQQYYFSFPSYTFIFCKVSHRFITGSQGSNTITYSALCA